MIMYEQDPDVLRWGLHLLLGDTSNSAYCETSTQNDVSRIYEGDCAREINIVADHTTTENDAVIAHALQEEFSQVSVAEASGHSHEGEEHLQASVLSQDWFCPSTRTYDSGNEGTHEETYVEPSNLSSSPGNTLNEGVEFSLELTDFSGLDGEVGKRLNQMVPIPVAYMILALVSPVTHSVANCVKRLVVIVASVLFFKSPVSPVNALGTGVALAGVFLYSRVKNI